MIPMVIKMQREGFPAAPVKSFRQAQRDGLRLAGDYWHRKILPLHFTAKAVGRYGYHNPSRDYMIRKAKGLGHQQPMVWSGMMRAKLLANAVIAAKGRDSAVVQMRGVRVLNLSNRKNYPDLRAQVTASDQADANELARVARRAAVASLRSFVAKN